VKDNAKTSGLDRVKATQLEVACVSFQKSHIPCVGEFCVHLN
jgi:hypothetical protein